MPPFVVAHIVHDLRPRDDALADRDATKALADALGLPFVEAEVRTKSAPPPHGNAESVARRLRYAALARLAAEADCPWIATAHHADDQLETMLMALVRGSGPRGLAGIARSRPQSSTTIIRPMLAVTRADAERLCLDAAWTWREDATNRDVSRLRAAIRHEVLPALRRIRPKAAHHAGEAAQLLADAAELIHHHALELVPRGAGSDDDGRADQDTPPSPPSPPMSFTWPRNLLRAHSPVILGELLRLAAVRLLHGQRRDRLGLKRLAPAIRHIRGTSTDPRRFTWSGLTLESTAHGVTLRAN